jgi:hypothetical protein
MLNTKTKRLSKNTEWNAEIITIILNQSNTQSLIQNQ